MNDYSKLKELAEGCLDEIIRSEGWAGMIVLRRDEQFIKECSPEVVLALIKENERLVREARNDAIAYKAVIERKNQIAPAWDGQGFVPPVGTVCEFLKHNSPPAPEGKWAVGDIRYVSDCTVVIGGDGCEHLHHPRNCSFRPVRTPEQIATEDRDKAVADMEEDIARWGLTADYNGMCQAMYDAGYRKQVQP